jgi:histidinol-phosphate aminotransferase
VAGADPAAPARHANQGTGAPLTRAGLESLPDPALIQADRDGPDRGLVELASNEIPYGPLPGVPEAIAVAAERVHRYPDMAVHSLRNRLAQWLSIDPREVATGCGSVALLDSLVRATCRPGDEVLHAWRSFEAYPIVVAANGAVPVAVPNDTDHRHDVAAMLAALTPRTRLVVVCNPNNPTGAALTEGQLDTLIDGVAGRAVVALDEAYREFVTDDRVPDGVRRYRGLPNVAVLRTFSKAWGLASLRCGYLVATAPLAATVRKATTPFTTNGLAQAAALAALNAEAEVRRRCALVRAERDRLTQAVAARVPAPASQANFVWLPVAQRARELADVCASHGVLVRAFDGEGVRVTIGTPSDNDAFLAALEIFLDDSYHSGRQG